ncbi:MAG: thioredoxin-like domain-containing protein [Longicatena sp.]
MKKELNYIKTAFAAEWLKIKNLGLLILAAIFAIIAPVLSFVTKIIFEDSRTYNGIESSAIQQSLLSLLGTYGGFLLILFIIISASRVAQIDHKNNGWTFLETQPLSKFSVYTGKFLVVVLLCLISEILFFVSTIFFACLTQAIFPQTNLDYSIDMFWILQTFLRLFIVGLGVISLQMMLSIIISGFIWPFVIGFLGLVLNVVADQASKIFDFFPYNNVSVTLSYPNSYELNNYFNYSEYMSVFWMIVFILIGYFWYSQRGFKRAFLKDTPTVLKTLSGIAVAVALYFFITKPIYPVKDSTETIIEGFVASSKPIKEISLVSQELGEPLAKITVKDGKFAWKSKMDIPLNNFRIIIDQKSHVFVLSKGDHLLFDIKTDPKNFKVIMKGTRKAENEFITANSNRTSTFYNWIVPQKQFTNKPEKFYNAAKVEWKEGEKYIAEYRTKENIYFADDFRKFQQQKNAVNMLNAIYEFQKMTSFSDKKFAPPKEFLNELQSNIKKPSGILLSTQEYKNYRIKKFLPEEGTKSPDSIAFSKISEMTPGLERDQLLSYQLIKMMELIKDEKQRNKLFMSKVGEFKDKKYTQYVAGQLQVINNQQKGKPFPPIAFQDESGKKVSFSKFKGKYIILDFWATWCGPCKETTPVFEYYANQYAYDDEIVFLSASVDEDRNKWKLDIKNKKTPVQQWWIEDPNALSKLGVNGIPRFMIIDPEGKIYNANFPRPDDSNFQDLIDELPRKENFKLIF